MSGPVGSGKSALVTAILGQVNTCEVAAPGFLKRGGEATNPNGGCQPIIWPNVPKT